MSNLFPTPRNFLTLMVLLLSATFVPPALAEEAAVPQPSRYGVVRALEVAYSHFAAELPRRRTGVLAEARNYRITITEEKAAYVVFFSPHEAVIAILDADWRYEIDRQDFRILSLTTDWA
ncbi:MAG: hypothetical protein LBS89_08400 [Zoogloeaceae bacterium]|jgi:hypothetical protein|nr:hypothetical protein [Zoogloeaceae bacterium]